MSSAEENKALVRRLIEANAKADLDTLDKLLAPEFVDHSPLPGHEPGREGFKQQIAEEYAIFSNIRINIDDQVAAEGDKVITRLSRKRIHDRGEYLGVAPTGMEYPSRSIVIHRIERGKVLQALEDSSNVSCRPRMAEARGSSPLGSTLLPVDSQVKREEQYKAPACSRALVQQPSGTTGSCSQSQTSFPPNSLKVHALLRHFRSC
jgi:predicted ester cyclase